MQREIWYSQPGNHITKQSIQFRHLCGVLYELEQSLYSVKEGGLPNYTCGFSHAAMGT